MDKKYYDSIEIVSGMKEVFITTKEISANSYLSHTEKITYDHLNIVTCPKNHSYKKITIPVDSKVVVSSTSLLVDTIVSVRMLDTDNNAGSRIYEMEFSDIEFSGYINRD